MNERPHNCSPWLHRFILVTAVATFLLLGSGGMVTSHEAGMSVPDWPNTYGYNMFAFPFSKWVGGIFYEHTHRLLASGIGLLTTVLAVWLWFKDSRRWMRWLGGLAFVLVSLQGVLGGLRVTLDMDKLGIVHGALAQLFFVLICALALFTSRSWQNQAEAGSSPPAAGMSEASLPALQNLKWLVLATTILIFLQLVLGATMRHQHAGLAIPDFPTAYGKIWPDTSAAAVAHYNEHRMSVIAENPITAAQIILQMVHRIVALVIFMGVVVSMQLAWRRLGRRDPLTRLTVFWLALIAGQIALGAWTIWSNKAADVATAHVLVGALSLVTGVLWYAVAFHRLEPLSRIEPAGTIPGAFGAHPAMVGNK